MQRTHGQTYPVRPVFLVLVGLATLLLAGCMLSRAPQAVPDSAEPALGPTSVAPSAPQTALTPAPPPMTKPATIVPSATAEPTATTRTPQPPATPQPTPQGQDVKLTIVYDNNPHDLRLTDQWGFACLVEYGDHTILFDTGADGPTLLANMVTLGIDPGGIEAVLLSHEHADHTGGLGALLNINSNVTVYAPHVFASSVRSQVLQAGARLVEIDEPLEIMPGVYSTGQVSGTVIEQALALQSPRGLVVITGCAHPGIVRMVEQATKTAHNQPYLVLGGFHLGNLSDESIDHIIAEFRRLGVRKAGPTHCSGDRARELFAMTYGDDYLQVGLGRFMTVSP